MSRWNNILSHAQRSAQAKTYYCLSSIVMQPSIFDVLLYEGDIRGAIGEGVHYLTPVLDERKVAEHPLLLSGGTLIGENEQCALVYYPHSNHYHVMKKMNESALESYLATHFPDSDKLSPVVEQLRNRLVMRSFEELTKEKQPIMVTPNETVLRLSFDEIAGSFRVGINNDDRRVKTALNFPFDHTLTLQENLHTIYNLVCTLPEYAQSHEVKATVSYQDSRNSARSR